MARLEDIFTISSGGTPRKNESSYYDDGIIPWIKTGDLKEKYISNEVEHITEEGLNHSSAKLFPKDTVLVAMYGATIGACSILSYEASTNQACAAFLPNENVIPEYLYYFLCSHKEKFIKDGVGGAQPNISAGYLKNVKFELIPLDEQQKIIDNLNEVDDLISLRKQQLAKLDELVKSRFVELFGGEKYAKKPIRELVDRKIASARKTYGCDDTIHYIDISSIDNKANVVTGTTEYIMADAPSRAQQCIQYGDILISTVRPNLRNIARNDYSGDKYVASSGFCVLRAKNCDTRFLLCAVLADDFTNAMTEVTTGANYPAIKDSDVLGYRIPAPPIELQKQFAAFVEQTDKSKFEIQKSLNQLETLKKALMQKYFG